MVFSNLEHCTPISGTYIQQLIGAQVNIDADALVKLTNDIEEDLLSFNVTDSSSPMFEKLVTAHLIRTGYSAHVDIDDSSYEDDIPGQIKLFNSGEFTGSDFDNVADDEVESTLFSSIQDIDPTSADDSASVSGYERSSGSVNTCGSLEISENARRVLQARYLMKDNDGKIIETAEQLFMRVAENIAKAEDTFKSKLSVRKVADEFYSMMTEGRFMPNSPTLMNAGRDLQQLSACFVLPIEDSMESIFESIKNTALIQKSGGGTGFSFSRLRPKDDRVRSTKGVSSGPVSFMKAFDAATETVKQGGTRRGANMAVLRVDHPDILDFISCKRDQTQLNNFNISVGITKEFMEALKAGKSYKLYNPRSQEVSGTLDAKKVFDTIVNLAWLNGEPGMIFIDRVNEANPTPECGPIEATNPCGEQPLLPYESCNLGSINLSTMVCEEKGKFKIDYKLLGKTVKTSVRFLDNVIEQNVFPLKAIEKQTKQNRKIGLGVMGWADMLIKMGIPYASEEAVTLAGEVMGYIKDEAGKYSVRLAKERGEFPGFSKSMLAAKGMKPRRNAAVTTIAPTGSISIIGNCSSGIEPLFAVCYIRRILDGQEMVEVHPYFLKVAKDRGFFKDELLQRIAEKGSLESFEEIPDDVKAVFQTTRDISPQWHIKMQAAFQNHIDSAVSKTVNFPNSATREDVRDVYKLAYELGCKGVTVYRDGSRDGQVLNLKAKEKKEEVAGVEEPALFGTSCQKGVRPAKLLGYTHRVRTSEGKFYLTVNELDGRPFEIFSTANSKSSEASINAEALCRLVSLALRHGVKPKFIHDQLVKTRNQSLLSLPYNVSKVLEPYYEITDSGKGLAEGQLAADLHVKEELCPECGTAVEHEGGCMVCRGCGFSKCA
jgi:ribonucleoside-diphosphate reductase alpha chain